MTHDAHREGMKPSLLSIAILHFNSPGAGPYIYAMWLSGIHETFFNEKVFFETSTLVCPDVRLGWVRLEFQMKSLGEQGSDLTDLQRTWRKWRI